MRPIAGGEGSFNPWNADSNNTLVWLPLPRAKHRRSWDIFRGTVRSDPHRPRQPLRRGRIGEFTQNLDHQQNAICLHGTLPRP
jgi:hypothetical protein